MIPYLIAGIGTSIGALTRFYIMDSTKNSQSIFPWSTFTINMVGCLLIGICFRYIQTPLLKDLLIAGIIGGLTTFSTFANEIVILYQTDRKNSLLYLSSSVILGLILVQLGISI